MSSPLFHGTRAALAEGDLVTPGALGHVFLTANLDEAIWSAELAEGEAPAKIYVVAPLGAVAPVSELAGHAPPRHPAMSSWSREALRVIGEVQAFSAYHGTRADLCVGDRLAPGYVSNFGATPRTANHIYFARTLEAAVWGAEIAVGEGRPRIYVVEPTGPVEDDPNLTNKRFRGNPSRSFRSREALVVTGEVTAWRGHAAEAVRAMKEGIARMQAQGIGAED